jgi:hypothetical protein
MCLKEKLIDVIARRSLPRSGTYLAAGATTKQSLKLRCARDCFGLTSLACRPEQAFALAITAISLSFLCVFPASAWAADITTGLVGHWTLDTADISGTTVLDTSGNGHNGTITGATGAAGKINQALLFDGSSNYITVPGLDLTGTNVITVSFWLNTTYVSDDDIILETSANSNFNAGAFKVIANGSGENRFWVDLVGNVGKSSGDTADYSDNTWRHFAVVMDMGRPTNEVSHIYMNGVDWPLQHSYDSNNNGNFGNYTLYMMSRAGSSLFADGLLDDVRIYTRELSSDDVVALYQLGGGGAPADITTGLIGWWKFDEGSGGTVADSSGSNNTGTIYQATFTSGKLGQALSFDGVDDTVTINALNLGTAHSASMWIDWQDAGDGVVIGGASSSPAGYVLYVDGANVYYNSSSAVDFFNYVSVFHGGLTAGQWNNICVVRDGTSVTFYKNGAPLGIRTLSSDIALSGITTFGSYASGDYPSRMSLDEVRIYSRVLTADEVAALYAVGFGGNSWHTFIGRGTKIGGGAIIR